jgi:hypothetical protein
MPRNYVVCLLTLLVALTPGAAYAQTTGGVPENSVTAPQPERPLDPRIIRASVQGWRLETKKAPSPSIARSEPRRSKAKRAAFIVGGTVAGFFAGAFIGAGIENQLAPCNCDDPGLLGALWGAPIGALTGAIATALTVK